MVGRGKRWDGEEWGGMGRRGVRWDGEEKSEVGWGEEE